MARPTDGLKHVDRLSGSAEQKLRLRLVLEVLQGRRTIEDACAVLGIKPARFHELRTRVLEGALAALLPGKPGRPGRPVESGDASAVRDLAEQNTALQEQLHAARLREEIALTAPYLLRRQAEKKSRNRRRKRRRS